MHANVSLALALVLALVASGCTSPGPTPSASTRPTGTTPNTVGPPLHFGGLVADARDRAPLENASVRIDLAQTRPCRNEGIGWAHYDVATRAGGRFGPVETPRPNSDDFAFFVHVEADGYAENVTFVGPAEARDTDLGNLTIPLHPRADVSGSAPPVTVLALDDAPFPRVTVSDANGSWRFANARALPTALVAATDAPWRALAAAPATLAIPQPNATGWRLEGRLVTGGGAPVAADVIARNGSQLWSAARAGENGFFVLPLDAAPASLVMHARTADGHYGGTKLVNVTGPPALRETLVMVPLC